MLELTIPLYYAISNINSSRNFTVSNRSIWERERYFTVLFLLTTEIRLGAAVEIKFGAHE